MPGKSSSYIFCIFLFFSAGAGFAQSQEGTDRIRIKLDSCYTLAENLKLQGRFAEEEQCYLEMLVLQESIDENPSLTLINLARYYVNHGFYKKGIQYSRKADSALTFLRDTTILDHHNREFIKGKMKGMTARAFRFWGYYDSALYWHRRAILELSALDKKNNNVDIPNQWEGIGYIFVQKGVYDSAMIYLEKSARLREYYSDWLGAGEGLDGLAYLSWITGDEENAVNYYRQAIEMKSRFSSKAPFRINTYKESLSVTYLGLGKAYASLGMTESAFREFDNALELSKAIGFRRGEAEILTESGKLYTSLGQHDIAEKVIKEALLISNAIDYKAGQADAIITLGDLYVSEDSCIKSLEYFNEAEIILREIQAPHSLTDVWIKTGLNLLELNRNGEAEKYLLNALQQARKFNFFRMQMTAMNALYILNRDSGKLGTALDYYQDYLSMKDSINNQETYFLLAEYQLKQDSEFNRRRIEILEQENQVKALSLARSNLLLVGVSGLVFLLIVLSVSVIRTIKLRQIQHESILQEKLFRTRMSPDFIHNSLANIKELVLESRTTEASDYIIYFSRIMQYLLEGARSEFVPFYKGISMLRSYFELLRFNHKGKFDFRIIIDEKIEQDLVNVPSFLEEVLAPGFKAEPMQRFIRISFTSVGNKILIAVESMGKVADYTGISEQENRSLLAIKERLHGMSKRFKMRLDFSISELRDENNLIEGSVLSFEVPAIYASK